MLGGEGKVAQGKEGEEESAVVGDAGLFEAVAGVVELGLGFFGGGAGEGLELFVEGADAVEELAALVGGGSVEGRRGGEGGFRGEDARGTEVRGPEPSARAVRRRLFSWMAAERCWRSCWTAGSLEWMWRWGL